MKKKLFIVLTAMALIFTIALPSSADDYTVTLQELLDGDGGGLVITRSGTTSDKNCTYLWQDNGRQLFIYGLSGLASYSNLSLSTYAHSKDIEVKQNNFLILKGANYLVNTSYPSVTESQLAEYDLDVYLYFTDTLGETVVYTPEVNCEKLLGNNYGVRLSYDISFRVPNDFVRLEAIDFVYSFPAMSYGNNLFLAQSGDITFFLGDSSDAPLYSGADDSSLNSYEDKEAEVMNNAQEGLSETRSFISAFQTLFTEGGVIPTGMMFMTGLMEDLRNRWPWFNTLLVISLALGVLLIILGVVEMFTSKQRGK